MSRQKTVEEVRQEFLDQMKGIGREWLRIQKEENYDTKRTMEGFLFSIYNVFDGTSCLPGFDIIVRPHPDDKQFHIDEGENYYEDVYLHEIKGSTDL